MYECKRRRNLIIHAQAVHIDPGTGNSVLKEPPELVISDFSDKGSLPAKLV